MLRPFRGRTVQASNAGFHSACSRIGVLDGHWICPAAMGMVRKEIKQSSWSGMGHDAFSRVTPRAPVG
eukprot:8972952-Alexandrium_andersonii.AAC.1